MCRVNAARHCLVLVLALAPGVLRADPAPAVSLVGDSACPDRAAVAAELRALLPGIEERANGRRIEVEDLGPHYRVSVAREHKELVEEARDCARRARTAAVVVLLVLRPPMLAPLEPAEVPAPAKVATRFDIDVAAVVSGAPRTGSDNGLVAGGGSARASLRWGWLGGSLGITGLSPSTMRFGDVQIRLVRVPMDLSLQGVLTRGRIEWVGNLGFAVTVLRVEGVGLPSNTSATRVEPGARLGADVRVRVHPRLALRFGVEANFAFQSSQLAVDPIGVVGTTPIVWLGATAGLSVRVH